MTDPIRHLDFPTPTNTLTFDDAHLPTGDHAARMWPKILDALLDAVAADGWDQPARLYVVLTPAATRSHPIAPDLATIAVSGDSTAYAIVDVGPVEGHPALALQRYTAPHEAAAVVLVSEAWQAPAHPTFTPSANPDRLEVRLATAATRTGALWTRSFTRGSDAPVSVDPGSGILVDTLLSSVGQPVRTPYRPVSHLLAAAALHAAAVTVAGLRDDPHGDTLLGDDPHAIAAAYTAIGPVATIMLGWAASGHGRHGVTPAARTLMNAVVDHRRLPSTLTRDERVTINDALHTIGDLPWRTVLSNRHARVLLARESRHVHAHTNEALASALVMRWSATPEDLFDDVRRRHGDIVADAAASIVAPWWTPR